MLQLDAKAILAAVGETLAEERTARMALAARVAEMIDDYGNVVSRPVPVGEKGETGERGEPGRDGRDGRPGEIGPQGPPGEAGASGERGLQGESGHTGPKGENGSTAYPGAAKGLYNLEEKYRALDVVAWNGCEWRAAVDDPGPLPGPDWVLGAKGARGKMGPQGPKGDPAPRIVDISARDFELILTTSDGARHVCNLLPVFERYHREAAA